MVMRAVRYVGLMGIVAGLLMAAAGAPQTTLKGVLIDKRCSYDAKTRVMAGPRLVGGMVVAYTHTRECALKPECQRSGYGVFTYDQEFVPFDADGNEKALAFFQNTDKQDDFRVQVTGRMEGEVMHVASIELPP